MHHHHHERGRPPSPLERISPQYSTFQRNDQQEKHRANNQNSYRQPMTDRQLQRQIMGMAMPPFRRIDGVQHAERSRTPSEPRAGRHQFDAINPLA